MTPSQQLDKKYKKVQNFSSKWLKTAHLQLSQKSLETCLRKLTIIASFIPSNNLLFFFKSKNRKKSPKKTKKREKKVRQIFNFFLKWHKKRCQGGRRLHCQRPSSVFKEYEAEEANRKKNLKIKKKKKKSAKFFF